MVQRRWPGAALLTMALVAVIAPTGAMAQDAPPPLPDPFVRLGDDLVLPDAVDLRGGEVAWAAAVPEGVAVRVANLSTAETRTLTTIPAAGGAVTIDSLAFDGRWVVWSDDRFGQFDVFAVNANTSQFLQVRGSPADERDVDVDGGRAVWTRQGTIETVQVGNGTAPTVAVRGAGPDPHPAVRGDVIAYVQTVGSERFIRVARVGGEDATVARGGPGIRVTPAFDQAGPAGGPYGLVWALLLIPSTGQTVTMVESALVDPTDLTTAAGSVENLTNVPVPRRDPDAALGRVAWRERTQDDLIQVVVAELATGRTLTVDGPVGAPHLSRSHLAVVRADDGPGPLYVLDLRGQDADPPGADTSWVLLVAGAVVVAVGVGWAVLRARR